MTPSPDGKCDSAVTTGFRDLLLAEAALPPLSEAQLRALKGHYELLARWNQRLNLTSLRSVQEAVRFHYAESLFFASQLVHLPDWPQVRRICDVGSGAGFPGIAIAVLYPDREVHLIESHQRKAVFLRESTSGWSNIVVSPRRFEGLPGEWDLVTSRAVAWKDIIRQVHRVARDVALIAGPSDVSEILSSGGVVWGNTIDLPHGRGSALLGSVSRGTKG